MNSGAAIEYQALTWEICSDDGTSEGTHLERWSQLLLAGAKAMGRDVHCVLRIEEWLKELGFVDVRREQVLLPSKTTTSLIGARPTQKNVLCLTTTTANMWPRERRWNLVGRFTMEDLCMGIDGVSRRLLTAAGLLPAQIYELLALVRADVRNTNIHAYLPL